MDGDGQWASFTLNTIQDGPPPLLAFPFSPEMANFDGWTRPILLLICLKFCPFATAVEFEWKGHDLQSEELKKAFGSGPPRIVANITIRKRNGNRFWPRVPEGGGYPIGPPFLPSPIANCGCCLCVQAICPCPCPEECRTESTPPVTPLPTPPTNPPSTPPPPTTTTQPNPPSSTKPSTQWPHPPWPIYNKCCYLLSLICSICSCHEKCATLPSLEGYKTGPPDFSERLDPFMHRLLDGFERQQRGTSPPLIPGMAKGVDTLQMPDALPKDAFLMRSGGESNKIRAEPQQRANSTGTREKGHGENANWRMPKLSGNPVLKPKTVEKTIPSGVVLTTVGFGTLLLPAILLLVFGGCF